MKYYIFSQIRIWFFLFSFIILLSYFPLASSEEILKQEENEKYKSIQFTHLNNNDLLQNAEMFYAENSRPFLTEIRAVANNSQQLKLLQSKVDSLKSKLKALKKPKEKLENENNIKLILRYSKEYHENLKKQEIILLNKKTLLVQQISQVETAQISADVFLKSFEKLNLYLLEIQLRELDNTLTSDKISPLLNINTVKDKQQDAQQKNQKLQKQLIKYQKELEEFKELFEPFSEKLHKAKVEETIANKQYTDILEQKNIRQNYNDKTVQELKYELQGLYTESHWLRRHSTELFQHLKKKEQDVIKQEKKIEQQKNKKTDAANNEEVSNITILQSLDTNNIQEAEKMTQQVMDFYDKRLKTLQSIQLKLEKLEKIGVSLSAEIKIFKKHLLKMKVLTTLLKEFSDTGKVDLVWIQKNDHSEELSKLNKILNSHLIDIFEITESSNKKKNNISTDIKASKQAKKDVTEKMHNIKKMFDNKSKLSKWIRTLEKIPTEKLLVHFKEIGLTLETDKEQLKNKISIFEKSEKIVEKSQYALDNIRDPLWQEAKKELSASENKIVKSLYEFADLKLPEKYIDVATPGITKVALESNSDKDEQNDKNSNKKISKDESIIKEEKKHQDKDNKDKSLKPDSFLLAEKEYQNTLSSWLFVFTEQEKNKLVVSEKITDMQKNAIQYRDILVKTRNIAKKYHADAVELKKRLIKNPKKLEKISSYQLTETINKALNIDFLENLDIQASRLLNLNSTIKQRIVALNTPDKLANEIKKILKEIEIIHAKQIETQLILEKLATEFLQQREELTAVELQRITQDAVRNLQASDNIKESMLNITNSTNSNKLTEILTSYYIELIELSNKGENINQQTKNINHIIVSIQNKKPLLEKLVNLLVTMKKEVELKRYKIESSIKISLNPEKSDDISQKFSDKTGDILSIPLVLEDKEKEIFIESNAQILFNYEVSLLSLDKWIALFKGRLKSTGLDYRIGQYQNKLGKLSSENIILQHHIYNISGNPAQNLKKLSKERIPKTAMEKTLFLKGKIGVIRNDRYQDNQQTIISLLIKLFSIVLITFISLKLINYIFRKLNKNKHDDIDPQNAFIRAFFKTFIKISIWSIAILLFLSNLGFQVGAILAGLGIGGFAIAIAAKETLSNILSGVTLFIEKPFKIGDTIKIDNESPQKVVNMTWRSTQLINSNLYYSNIPNSTVANANLINYTKNESSIDYVDINLLPKYDSETVTSIMLQSLDKCGDTILQDGKKDVKLVSINIYSETPFVLYRIKFCMADYHTRGAIRNKVLAQIKLDLEGSGIFIDIDLKFKVLRSPS